MQARVSSILTSGKDSRDERRYVQNSAHDTQVSNLVWWLDPLDYEWTDIPYASAVNFELHYDSDCISQVENRTEYCFTVEVTHDGKPLKFDTCLDNNTNRG